MNPEVGGRRRERLPEERLCTPVSVARAQPTAPQRDRSLAVALTSQLTPRLLGYMISLGEHSCTPFCPLL